MALRVVFSCIAALTAGAYGLNVRASDSGTLQVTGQGSVNVQTTEAEVSASVQKTTPCTSKNTNKCSGTKAQNEASQAMQNVLDYLNTAQGVANISTNNIIVQPQYNYSGNSPVLVGFQATQSVQFNVNTSDAGVVLQDILEQGITNLDNVNFVASPQEIQIATDQALQLAVADGQRQANAVLDSIGSSQGSINSIVIGQSTPPSPVPMAMMANGASDMAMKVPPPIQAGTQTITASVTLNMTYS